MKEITINISGTFSIVTEDVPTEKSQEKLLEDLYESLVIWGYKVTDVSVDLEINKIEEYD